ncbi:DUF2157 domain-containing protein [Novispirillum sp. DQ9]|uniref:DUF2157 domain-containing protein n=1 Tax=Novispirillum sp. DQ9 TaxID=3398612 RepID=UPI003C7E658F
MAPSPSPDAALTPGLVHRLWRAGAVPPGRYAEALDMARDDAAWALWGRRLLLAVAMGQILAAVVFFFAWNWADLPGLVKIALTLGLTVACALASRLRLREAARHALLFAAALLVGVTLAVYGQHFQTGADAWQLFAGWAALLVPWAATRRSPALWTLWLVVAEVALGFFLDTLAPDALPVVLLALLPALAVVAHDLAPAQVPRWMGLIGLTVVLALSAPLTVQAVSLAEDGMAWRWSGPLVLAAATAYTMLRLWQAQRDVAALSLAAMAVCGALSAIVMIEIDEWFLGSLVTAALFAGAAQGINSLRTRT